MLGMSPFITAYIIFMAALLGLVMGSFLNCFAYRYANGESVHKGRSNCALCGHVLGFFDLIPIFSWLFLKGKCRYCGKKISAKYLLSEIVCGLLYISVVIRFDITIDTLRYLLLISLLFAAAMTDIYCGLIPDRVAVIGTIGAFVFTILKNFESFSFGEILKELLFTLINGLSISLPLLILVIVFEKVMKKDSMGGGDIKLMFTIGLYFDWKLNLLIIILACITGIIFAVIRKPSGDMHGQEGAFSFGPALAVSAWIVMLFGQWFIDWYLGLFTF